MAGKFYGVGVGPGDAELLTLKAARVLREADLVFYPLSAPGESIAADIVTAATGRTEGLEALSFPMTKDRTILAETWATAAERIMAEMELGKVVAFVSLGDPLFFSTCAHLWRELRRRSPGLEGEIIPGITSLSVAAAAAGFPWGNGDKPTVIFPGLGDGVAVADALARGDTVAVLKLKGSFNPDFLVGKGRQVMVASRLGLPDGRIWFDPEMLRGRKLDYLSLLLVEGETDDA